MGVFGAVLGRSWLSWGSFYGRSGQRLSAGRSRARAPRPVVAILLACSIAAGRLFTAKASPHPARPRARSRRRWARFASRFAAPLAGCVSPTGRVLPTRPTLLRERSGVAVAPGCVEAGLAQRLAWGRHRRGCSAPRRRLALTPPPGLGLRQSTVVPCVSAGPASARLLMGALGSVLSAGRSRERAPWPVLCCILCSSRRYGTAAIG